MKIKYRAIFICPLVKEWTGTPTCTYTTTHMDKTVDVDKIKHMFMLLVLPTESVFNLSIKKHAIQYIQKMCSPVLRRHRQIVTKKVKFQIGQIDIVFVLKYCQYDIFFKIQLVSILNEDLFFKHQNDEIVTDTDLLLQKYNFVFGMIKRNLNVLSFDNNMIKVHFGTKFGILYHQNAVNIYIKNYIFIIYF